MADLCLGQHNTCISRKALTILISISTKSYIPHPSAMLRRAGVLRRLTFRFMQPSEQLSTPSPAGAYTRTEEEFLIKKAAAVGSFRVKPKREVNGLGPHGWGHHRCRSPLYHRLRDHLIVETRALSARFDPLCAEPLPALHFLLTPLDGHARNGHLLSSQVGMCGLRLCIFRYLGQSVLAVC